MLKLRFAALRGRYVRKSYPIIIPNFCAAKDADMGSSRRPDRVPLPALLDRACHGYYAEQSCRSQVWATWYPCILPAVPRSPRRRQYCDFDCVGFKLHISSNYLPTIFRQQMLISVRQSNDCDPGLAAFAILHRRQSTSHPSDG